MSTRTDSTHQASGPGGEQALLFAPAWPLFAGLGPLGALPTAPRLARAFSVLVLAGWGLADLAETCELVTSELTSNVIRAASGPDGHPRYDNQGRLPLLWLRLLADRARVRVEVCDNLAPELGEPVQRHAATTDESGRGLEIINGLSEDWAGTTSLAMTPSESGHSLPAHDRRPLRKGTAVHPENCSCGYQATGPDGLADHLREAFTPDDDKDADGQVHAEAAHDDRACLCGFMADDVAGLDAHLLLVFTPPDAIGRDGRKHV